jgi:hypothetical protein
MSLLTRPSAAVANTPASARKRPVNSSQGRLTRTPLHAAEYWTLSWFVASVATVGGALGPGLGSDEAIRAVAYSKRERERRHMVHDDHGDQPLK